MVLEIDAIYFLVFVELFVLVSALLLFYFMRTIKLKKLVAAASAIQPEYDSEQIEVLTETQPAEPEAVLTEAKEEPEPEPAPVIAEQEPLPEQVKEDVEDVETDELPSDASRLRELLVYQKDIIVDLMGYKEILEGANKKLRSIMDLGGDIQEGVMMLLGSLPPSDEQTSTFKKFEQNEKDMDAVVKTIDKQNQALAEKFSDWDEKFKNLLNGELAVPAENKEMPAKISALEADIESKDNEIARLKQQYEGLEAEYLLLYRQHHGSDKPEQPDI
ncbi:MAG: hypothetical protein RBT37_04145 [Dissulfurispiraceae bacterium]|nr:hypothetical protein [Dissulfurispiraceae bacterium]